MFGFLGHPTHFKSPPVVRCLPVVGVSHSWCLCKSSNSLLMNFLQKPNWSLDLVRYNSLLKTCSQHYWVFFPGAFLSTEPWEWTFYSFFPLHELILILYLMHKGASLSIAAHINWVKSFYLTYFLLEAMNIIDLCVCCNSLSSIFLWAVGFSSFSPWNVRID